MTHVPVVVGRNTKDAVDVIEIIKLYERCDDMVGLDILDSKLKEIKSIFEEIGESL